MVPGEVEYGWITFTAWAMSQISSTVTTMVGDPITVDIVKMLLSNVGQSILQHLVNISFIYCKLCVVGK